jgi:hypothetical protein
LFVFLEKFLYLNVIIVCRKKMMECLGGEIERKFPEGCIILPPASSLNLKIDEMRKID